MTTTSSKFHESSASSGVRLVKINSERDGQRLDNFLIGLFKGVPKNLVYRVIRTGQVRVNGKRVKPDMRIAENDEIRIPPVRLPDREEKITPSATQLNRLDQFIVYEDRDFLVIDKPAGMASHGGSGINFGAIELLRMARPKDTLELVHRLDRDTSGILVLSRKRSALSSLQTAIRTGAVTKNYLTLLKGRLPQQVMTVNAPLRKSVLQSGERMVRIDPEGKSSITHLHVIEHYHIASFTQVMLETGRTHQIRVHCQHIEHSIAGDEKYGEPEFNRQMRACGLKRLFLHAAQFEFYLSDKDRDYSFSAPLPPDLTKVLEAL